jgi:aquaporin Z
VTARQEAPTPSPLSPLARYEQNVVDRITDFNDPHQEWRRLFSELLGTFFLVLAAAGGGMMSHAFPGVISHTAAVTAPALTVMAIILFMGKISGAHLNPAVSIAFALRRDFPWSRVPGYIVVQLIGPPSPPWSCTPSSTCRPPTGPATPPTATPAWPRSGWNSS